MTSAGSRTDHEIGRLLVQYRPAIQKVVRDGRLDEADREDAEQVVLLRAFERLATLRERAHFGAWLRRLARNVVFDFKRGYVAGAAYPTRRGTLRAFGRVMGMVARALVLEEIRAHVASLPTPDEERAGRLAVAVLRRIRRDTLRPRPGRPLSKGATGARLAKFRQHVAPLLRPTTASKVEQMITAPPTPLVVAARESRALPIGVLAARPDPRTVIDAAIRQIEMRFTPLSPGKLRAYLAECGFTHAEIAKLPETTPYLARILRPTTVAGGRQSASRARRRGQ